MDTTERQQSHTSFLTIILILGLLSAFGPFSIDMYLPAFPAIAKDMRVPISSIQLSLTSYFVGLAVGQILVGPISDRWGRKLPLNVGLFLYTCASLLCAFSTESWQLIGLRFVQALGGSAGMVLSRAIVRDLFDATETARIFSLLMLIMGIAPVLAPTVGGVMVQDMGWESLFVFLTVLGILTMACLLLLPESHQPDKEISLRPAALGRRFRDILRNRIFLTNTLLVVCFSGALFAYISGSPFLFMELLGASEAQYAWIFGSNAASLILGSQINRQLLKRHSPARIVAFTVPLQLLVLSLFIGGVLLDWSSLYFAWALLFCFTTTLGYLSPNVSALALSPFKQEAGAASALMGCLQFTGGALSSGLVSLLHNGTALPMAGVLLFFSTCALLLVKVGYRR